MATINKITRDNYTPNIKGETPFPVFSTEYNKAVDQINTNTADIATNTAAIAATAVDVGADPTPVVRTNNPIIGTNTVNANIDALDATIGADMTPVARTQNHPVVSNSTVNAKIDELDAAIGFDAQLSGTPKDIANTASVYQNLDKLDTFKTVRTIKKTIGGVGVAGVDYNFVTAADQAEQVITLANILPAKARLLDVEVFSNAQFTGAVSLGIEVGTTSGGGELIASTNMYALNAIIATVNAGAFITLPAAAASSLYVSGTPGANWSLNTAGSLSVYVTFIDITNI